MPVPRNIHKSRGATLRSARSFIKRKTSSTRADKAPRKNITCTEVKPDATSGLRNTEIIPQRIPERMVEKEYLFINMDCHVAALLAMTWSLSLSKGAHYFFFCSLGLLLAPATAAAIFAWACSRSLTMRIGCPVASRVSRQSEPSGSTALR